MKRILGLVLVLICIIQVCCYAAQSDDARRYQQAQMFMKIGDYATAARLFDELGDYEDSAEMAAKARQMVGGTPEDSLKSTPTSDIFIPETTPTPMWENTTPNPVTNTVSVGDVMTFGKYEQDGNTRNGDEPIEWTVLTVKGNKALLLSKYGLDMKPYNTKRTSMTWAECSLRKWLNNDFVYAAFNSGEAERIESSASLVGSGSAYQGGASNPPCICAISF